MRVNLKIDWTFWTFVPYTEEVGYIINNKSYRPKSYRFLCFALIIVVESNAMEYMVSDELKEFIRKETSNRKV